MITIKIENCPTLFNELKTGDIFSFVTAPGVVYVKTDKNYSIDFECGECNETGSIDVKNFCVALATGAFYVAAPHEKVIVYKKAELILSV